MKISAHRCWFLTGPTASGKSRAAMAIALRFDAEIIALDSMTLYRGMNIGTDKPSVDDRQRVRHHLIDVLEPWEGASLDRYLRWAEEAIQDIVARGRQPLFVGGTPLYLKACLRGIFDGPPADPALRGELAEIAKSQGQGELVRRLHTVDPKSAAKIKPTDTRRLIRALEVHALTGKAISDWQTEFDQPAEPTPAVACLVRPRSEQRSRIDQRVLDSIDRGWIEEVRALTSDPKRPLGPVPAQAVGYAEIARHLAGELDHAEMIERIQIRTRQFSKRQMTWFRHLEECTFFETSDEEPEESLTERLCAFFADRDPRKVST